MLLPSTDLAALLLLAGYWFCLGSWANTQKLAGKWRFELLYYDFALGMLLTSVVAAFALGEIIPKELTFSDNFLIAAKRQMAWAVAAGVVFNIGNLLLIAAASVGGLSLAFPVTLGIAMVELAAWNFGQNPQGSAALIFGGAILVISAIAVLCFAYSGLLDLRQVQALAAFQVDPRSKKKPKQESSARAVVLAVIGGVIMGWFYPLLEVGRRGDAGVAPYGLGLLFAGGAFLSTLLFVPFFLNFPIQGEPLELTSYFKGSGREHLLGLTGGIVCMAGLLCGFVQAGSTASSLVNPALRSGFDVGVPLLAAMWGIFAWREFNGANLRIGMLLLIMFVLFATGGAMIAFGPLHAK
jgi:glucose uptake protein